MKAEPMPACPLPIRSRLLPVALVSGLLAFAPVAKASDLVVFAAASLKTALDDVAERWTAETGGTVAIAYAGSSALARQIEQGAPADLFVSADMSWMDYLDERGLVRRDTRVDLLGNRIVLIAHGRGAAAVDIADGFDLAGLLGDAWLAMADVAAVPAGRYGKASLMSLGVWTSVEHRVAQAENVRAALALVARGEAPFGIVYATDAAAEDNVTVVGTFPEDTHPPIIYPVAATADAMHEDVAAFLDYLASDSVRPLFERQGFTMLDQE